MSGILGAWNLDGRPLDKDVLERMAATLAHRGPDGCFFWTDGPVGLAFQQLKVTPESLNETQPLAGPIGAVVVFDGRLDNREELLAALPQRKIPSDAPDSALVLAAYAAFGEGFAEHLNGDFAVAVFDPKRRQLLLARDALGVRPLYYAQAGQSFLFASEVKALLAHPALPRRPNDDVVAWWVLKRPGLDTAGRTFFEGVLSVRPAHLVTATLGSVASRRYWDFDRGRRLRLGSFPEYAEAFGEHFERAVKRRLRSAHPVAFSVSGGLDSSAIICTAYRMKQKQPSALPELFGLTHVFDDGIPCDDKYFITEIEHMYGVTFERLPASPGFLDLASEWVWSMEVPLMDEMAGCTHALFSRVRAGGARSLVTGHWGDQVLFDQSYLVTFFRRFAWGEIHRNMKAYTEWYPELPLSYIRRQFLRDLVRSHVPEPLKRLVRKYRMRYGNSSGVPGFYTTEFRRRARFETLEQPESRGFASSHARALYHIARSGYYLLCLELDNKLAAREGMEWSFPFLDRDLVAFLMASPGEMLSWQGVPKGILREALKAVLPGTIGLRRGKADDTDFSNDAMSAARPRMLQLLEKDGQAVRRGYVRPEVAEELRRAATPGKGATGQLTFDLSELFGLELWLRLFFGKDASERNLTT